MSKHDEMSREPLSESIACMVHAFSDDGRRAAIRDLASRAAALEAQVVALRAGLEGMKDHGGAYDPQPSSAVQDLYDEAKRVLAAADKASVGK